MTEPQDRRPKEIGRVFMDRGLITEDQLQEALSESQRVGGLLGRVLVDLGYVTEADLVRALTEQVGLEFVDLDQMEIADDVVGLVDAEVAWRYLVIPVGERDGELLVATSDPANTAAFEELEKVTGRKVRALVANRPDIARLIRERIGEAPSDTARLEPLSRREPWHPWTMPGDNTVGGRVFASVILAHTEDDVVLALDDLVAYPYGFSFTLQGRRKLGRKYDDWWESVADERRRTDPDGLHLALEFADGTLVESSATPAWFQTGKPSGPFLARAGGSSDPWSVTVRFWAWPLPPRGPIRVRCSWQRIGVWDADAFMEGEAIRLAAERSVLLWPDPAN